MLHLENDHLRFELATDSSARLTVKKDGTVWEMGPVAFQDVSPILQDVVWTRNPRDWADYYMGRFRVEPLAGGAPGATRVTVLGPPWRPADDARGSFRATWSLDGPELVLRIDEVDERLPSLNYPPALRSASLLLPERGGRRFKEGGDGMRSWFITHNNGLNMRWVGGLDAAADRGWILLFEEDYAYSGAYRNNLAITPCFLKCKGRWNPARSVRYAFTAGGHVPLAKRFRRFAIDHGLHVSLREKIDRTPALARLLGGRIVGMFQCSTHHAQAAEDFLHPITPESRARDGRVEVNLTHADAAGIIARAKSWGMQRGLFVLRGTFAGGYDERHPDIWPPEPALGTLDELRALLDQPAPYLTALHDNYQDIYAQSPSFPHGIVRTADDRLLFGGYWHGGLTYITCSRIQLENARRNWTRLATLGLQAHFVDTLSCVRFYECHDPAHPTDQASDGAHKVALMQFFKDQGVVLGSEEAADFGLAHIDWLENRDRHVPGLTPPLWPLVFHDAAFFARYPTGGTSGGRPAPQLENHLWGYMAYWPANDAASWPAEEAGFRASLGLDALHARIGLDEMTGHRFLDDGLVERTEFASGVAVVANFAAEPREVDGRPVPPQGHLVLG